MIKEILLFIKWQWRKCEFWQRCYLVGAFFLGMAAFSPSPYNMYIAVVPVAMFFVSTFKWWMFDPMMESWRKYKKEKQNLFDTIKGD
jgi:hypothetical protein